MDRKKYSWRLAAWGCLVGFFPILASVNTDGQKGTERTVSAVPLGKATLNFGATVDYASSADYVKGPTFAGFSLDNVVDKSDPAASVLQDPAKMLSSDLYMGVGISDFWDVSLALPFYYDWAGFGDVRDGGLGDLEITTKLLLPPVSLKKFFYQSLVVSMTAPTGMRGNGLFPRQTHFIVSDTQWNPAQNFYSTDYITVKPMLAFTLDFGSIAPSVPVQLHGNVGGVFTGSDKQNTMVGAVAVEYRPADYLTLFADFSGEARWQDLSAGYNIGKDPLYATPGLRINTPSGMYLTLAGDFSMSSASAADRLNWDQKGFQYSPAILPQYGVRLSFGWNGLLTTPDKLREGPAARLEQCLNKSQLSDAVSDADGCPDFDHDTIGASETTNRCWKARDSAAEVFFEDECPDPDNTVDSLEQGRLFQDNTDGVVENNEIPDYESAFNGSPDSSTNCFGGPDEKAGYQDLDGCPDRENAANASSVGRDSCRGAIETGGGFRDDAGCPDSVVLAPPKKGPEFPSEQIIQGLEFRNGKAELLFSSYSVLDRLAKSLKDFGDVRVEVRGYTDALGKAGPNTQLSQMRAEAVRQYLINQGIDPQRIRALGFGPSNPIGDNRTAAGRELNRRIEVVKINRS